MGQLVQNDSFAFEHGKMIGSKEVRAFALNEYLS